jgi:hypothetical protein
MSDREHTFEGDPPHDSSAYGLVLPFDSDDPEFTRGVECGMVWTLLRYSDERTFMAHTSNTEMLMRIGEATGYRFRAKQHGDDWIEVTYAD